LAANRFATSLAIASGFAAGEIDFRLWPMNRFDRYRRKNPNRRAVGVRWFDRPACERAARPLLTLARRPTPPTSPPKLL
jgi:hypothetical protein